MILENKLDIKKMWFIKDCNYFIHLLSGWVVTDYISHDGGSGWVIIDDRGMIISCQHHEDKNICMDEVEELYISGDINSVFSKLLN